MSPSVRDRHEALLRSGSKLQSTQILTQRPGGSGVLIELAFVGVCGTDLQILNGRRPDTAEILGHEGVGTVVEAGELAPLHVGEHVMLNPCAQLPIGRILGHNTPGLFQKRLTVDSHAVADGLVIPTRRSDIAIHDALVEPLGAVIYAHRLIANKVSPLRTAVVLGAGTVGLLAATYLTAMGVQVWLAHPTQARLDTAIALGIVNRASTLCVTENLPARVLSLNKGKPLDAGLICTTRIGAPTALQHALEVVRDGGCVDLITNYPHSQDPPYGIKVADIDATRAGNVNGMPSEGRYLTVDIRSRRIALTGHRGTHRDHLEHAMRTLRSGSSAYEKLITHTLPLHEAAQAIEHLSHTQIRTLNGRDCIKLIIDMTTPRSAAPAF